MMDELQGVRAGSCDDADTNGVEPAVREWLEPVPPILGNNKISPARHGARERVGGHQPHDAFASRRRLDEVQQRMGGCTGDAGGENYEICIRSSNE